MVVVVLFRFDFDGGFYCMEEGMIILNGMSWLLDDKIMYLVDMKDCNIYKYDFDVEMGVILNKRVFF